MLLLPSREDWTTSMHKGLTCPDFGDTLSVLIVLTSFPKEEEEWVCQWTGSAGPETTVVSTKNKATRIREQHLVFLNFLMTWVRICWEGKA